MPLYGLLLHPAMPQSVGDRFVKLRSWLALLSLCAAVALALMLVLIRASIDRVDALLVGAFLLTAAFFVDPELVSGWITRVLDRLPLGRRGNGGAV